MPSQTLVQIDNIKKYYPVRSGFFDFGGKAVKAVDGVSLNIYAGETIALVGESGCGKSTLARLVLRLLEPTGGTIRLAGEDIYGLKGDALKAFHQEVQIIFQDPVAALNPRKNVYQILKDPLLLHGLADASNLRERVSELLERVGLVPASAYLNRNPSEFSGGQRQRIVVARALSVNPRLIVADEPVSALDISIRAQILELLKKLQRETGVTFLFITHDLSVVRSIAQRVAVMYLGKIVEVGSVEKIFNNPSHPYTIALLRSTPIPDPVEAKKRQIVPLSGEIPSATEPPPGCHFHTRCPFVFDRCRMQEPPLTSIAHDQEVACHLVEAGDLHLLQEVRAIN